MGKVIIILTILIISDMIFHWGLPMGGIIFLIWLFLFGFYGKKCQEELEKSGEEKSVDIACIILWWLLFGGVCLLGNHVLGTVIGILLIIISGALLIGWSSNWNITDKNLMRKKYYINLVYAVLFPIAVYFIVDMLCSIVNKTGDKK